MTEIKKSYYAIIPANVRYDKSIRANAKLLYGEITALTNEKGYCWASNQYFANLYEVSKETISRWVSELTERGYITIELIYKEGSNQIINRYIRINQYPVDEIINTPIDENVKDNNTSFNTTINTTFNNKHTLDATHQASVIDEQFDEWWKTYDKKIDKKKALQKFKLALKKHTFEEIMKGTREYLKTIKDKQYQKYPVTFLNAESYLNEYEQDEIPNDDYFQQMIEKSKREAERFGSIEVREDIK